MGQLSQCPGCQRHVRASEVACPFCDHALEPAAARSAGVQRATVALSVALLALGCKDREAPVAETSVSGQAIGASGASGMGGAGGASGAGGAIGARRLPDSDPSAAGGSGAGAGGASAGSSGSSGQSGSYGQSGSSGHGGAAGAGGARTAPTVLTPMTPPTGRLHAPRYGLPPRHRTGIDLE